MAMNKRIIINILGWAAVILSRFSDKHLELYSTTAMTKLLATAISLAILIGVLWRLLLSRLASERD